MSTFQKLMCSQLLRSIYLKMYMNSSQNPSTSLKCFNVLEKLGEGSFASVYKVERIDDKKMYAMKKVKIGQMKQKERDNALNQVRVLASISHPNIVNYKEAFFDDPTQSLCIVMELADDGDIQKKINNHIKNVSHFTERQIWQALIQMAKGLRALHQIPILHRDLKCANVFCTKDNKYKLGDLNVSKVAKKGMARTQTGTPYYTSPQVWKDRPYDSKCDIWSLGCVIYEMASLAPPFRASNLKELYTKIQRGIYSRIPSFYSDDLAQIINACLKVNPSSRPTAIQILQNSKVVKNTPDTEKYAMHNDQTKKANLIGTILCPRNLKSLKMALPGAKYEQSPQKIRPSSVDGPREGSRRAISARNNFDQPIRNQIPRVINSPKMGELPKQQIKYAFQRRPSSERNIALPILNMVNKKEPISQIRQRQNSRLSRNGSRLVRNNSMDYMRKRNDSNRSIENNSIRKKDERSVEKQEAGKAFAEDISNRCRNIKERVEMLIANQQRVQRVQKVSNSYEKRYNLQGPDPRNSREKRDLSSGQRNLSRNNSGEIKVNNNLPISRPVLSKGISQRSLERNRSIERIERPNSRKGFEPPRAIPYRR